MNVLTVNILKGAGQTSDDHPAGFVVYDHVFNGSLWWFMTV
jgi:hypothetical protein